MKTFLLWDLEDGKLKMFTVNGTDINDAVKRFVDFLNQFLIPDHKIVSFAPTFFHIVFVYANGKVETFEYLIVDTSNAGVDITVER